MTAATRSAGRTDACRSNSFTWYGDRLHAGTWPLAHVACWDVQTEEWTDLGRLGDAHEINAMTSYNGKLYGGTIPRAEVFRYEGPGEWTPLHRFFEPPGWEPVAVEEMDSPPDGDTLMREVPVWVTSMTEHDGHLFASIGSWHKRRCRRSR